MSTATAALNQCSYSAAELMSLESLLAVKLASRVG
jgi:hypothetical protein